MTSAATWLILKVIALIKTSLIWALSRENLSSVVCDQSKTQTSLLSSRDQREAWNFGFSKYRYYTTKQRTTKLLIRLCGCTVLSQPLLFTYGINRFSHGVAHLIPNMVTFKKFNPKWHFRGWVQDWVNVLFFGIHDLWFFNSIIHTATKLW